MAEKFLSKADEADVIEAIREAESQTSGEIRVHIEQHTDEDHFERAKQIFHLLKMDNTLLRNGVLIYVAVSDHRFVICGDKGINDVVEPDFWDCTKDAMADHFKKGAYKQGLIAGIARAGERLQQYFPWQHGDSDQLSNEITRS